MHPGGTLRLMRFVHSSDWQIGKNFGFADEAAQALREERLDAITRLGTLARASGAADILVAGDVYDVQTPSDRLLRQPVERMRAFPDIHWHLIPGNHDPHSPRGPWTRLLSLPDGLPENIRLHLTPAPVPLAGGAAWLLPGVLTRRHAASDPTAPMDEAPTPEGAPRIGLAHGSVTEFGTAPGSTHNLISLDRPRRAGLAYLALGDWHGAKPIGDRIWYSGTPETDDFGRDMADAPASGGEALVVDMQGAAPPRVTRHATGRFRWFKCEAFLDSEDAVRALETRLRGLAPDRLGDALLWLRVSGGLSLAARQVFETAIAGGLGSALRVLRLDTAALRAKPTPADMEAIDHAGFLRVAAERLSARAASDPVAEQALQRLFILHGGPA